MNVKILIVGIVVVIVVVAGVSAYFMLKGPEGGVPPAGDGEEDGGDGGDGAPQAGAFTLTPQGTTENSTLLSWPQSTAVDFVSYEIYQSTSSGVLGDQIATITDKATFSIDVSVIDPSYPSITGCHSRVTGLSPNTTYYFTVRVNLADGTHEDSNQVSVETLQEAEIKWTFEGQRLSGVFCDQEVFQIPDNSYCMHFGGKVENVSATVASSPDGLTWTVESGKEYVGGGPSILKLPDGRCRAWWSIDKGVEEFDIKTAVSSDGYNWENETLCTSSNMGDFYGALPAVVLSPDGTYRMYYTRSGSETFTTLIGEIPTKQIYSAHSSDGLVWEPDPGIRIDGTEAVDQGHASSCDVYIREDGKYEMVYTGAGGWGVCCAVSDDGLNWTRMGYTGFQGWDPIVNVFPDGTIRMYYSNTVFFQGVTLEIPGVTDVIEEPRGICSVIREPI